jgi:hypothetical protein
MCSCQSNRNKQSKTKIAGTKSTFIQPTVTVQATLTLFYQSKVFGEHYLFMNEPTDVYMVDALELLRQYPYHVVLVDEEDKEKINQLYPELMPL